jgi:hypothetical protein
VVRDQWNERQAYVVVLEMGAEDRPAELSYVGDDEGGAELVPGDEVAGFGVGDHPGGVRGG